MKGRALHVAPSSAGVWCVRRSGTWRAMFVVRTKAEAVQQGRIRARLQGVRLYVHGADGSIQRVYAA